jgi:16S rRNA (adenine1518-N6/adenine1519-N6)-dimethyltransferase
MPLYRPSELSRLTHQLGVKAKKGLSQNFLIDGNILEKIVMAADIKSGDKVLEIGPGPGALTEALLKRGAHVTAIEKDRVFAKALRALASEEKLTIFEGDALKVDLPFKGYKVVANLPYQITSPILERLLPYPDKFSTLTLMVQREVGLRLTAQPRTPDYSSLSLFARYYSEPNYCFSVKPASFSPRPKVTSCVVHFTLKTRAIEPTTFFSVTRRAFGQKRKMLRSSLRPLFEPAAIEGALSEMGLKPMSRPQDLNLEEFAALAQRLYAGALQD